MTEQMIRRLFDFHRFSPSRKLEALIQDTDSRQASALSESELGYVNAAGVPEMMGILTDDRPEKDDPWKAH